LAEADILDLIEYFFILFLVKNKTGVASQHDFFLPYFFTNNSTNALALITAFLPE